MTSALTVLNSELVARVIFPPQMILDGKVMANNALVAF
jgi:hypothetical protein